MKVQVNKIKQKDGTILIMIEVNDELFASSRKCDDCVTLTEEFCKEWLNQGEPEEIELIPYSGSYFWSVNEQMIEVIQSNEPSLQPEDEGEETFEDWLVGNGLEITLPKSDLEKLEKQWNSMNHLYEIVCEESEDEDDEVNSPTYQQYQACENQLYKMVDKLKNQLPSPPNEVITYTDMYGNVYNSLEECELKEIEITFQSIAKKIGFKSKLNPNTPANWVENALGEELPILHRKHKLVKKQDLPKKVDFELLINSPYSIWNGGYEKAETQSITETVQQGELAAQNLELFLSLMKNPKFATRASFEIEKLLKKSKTI